MSIKLTPPIKEYAKSFAAALREGMELYPWPDAEIALLENDFDSWFKNEFDLTKPVKLPNGKTGPRVPHSAFWLVDGTEVLGRVSVRHHLTEALMTLGGHIGYAVRPSARRKGYGRMMLDMVIPHARAAGVKSALITCRDDNEGSIRIIEAAGAVLENKIPRPDGDVLQRRYWLKISD